MKKQQVVRNDVSRLRRDVEMAIADAGDEDLFNDPECLRDYMGDHIYDLFRGDYPKMLDLVKASREVYVAGSYAKALDILIRDWEKRI